MRNFSLRSTAVMEKYITFYPPKFESEKCYGRNAFHIVYSYREYSSCVEIFAKFWGVISQKREHLLKWKVSFIVYLHLYRIKTSKQFQKPKVYFAFNWSKTLLGLKVGSLIGFCQLLMLIYRQNYKERCNKSHLWKFQLHTVSTSWENCNKLS